MSSTDLCDAYYSVPVALSDQKYLVFCFEGQLYKYVCLPNGLSSAPKIFTKLLKHVYSVLRKQGHQIMGYLDNSFLVGDTIAECKTAVQAAVNLLKNLVFQIHPKKSQLIPKQIIEYLGFIINSRDMSVRLTPLTQAKVLNLIKSIISKQTASIRDIAKLVSTLEARLPGVQFGRLYLWHLQRDKNEALKGAHSDYDTPCKLSGNAYSELK